MLNQNCLIDIRSADEGVVLQGPSNISDIVLQEVVQHRNLYHPNIMLFRKVMLTETALGIVVEHAAGGNLQDYVRDSSPLQVVPVEARKPSNAADAV